MENKENNVLVGVILGGLATIGIITGIIMARKKRVFIDFSEKFRDWSMEK